jgi:hypothetical protein
VHLSLFALPGLCALLLRFPFAAVFVSFLIMDFVQAATTLKGDTSAGQAIVLAAVDVTVERSLGEKFDIKGFPTIKIFEGHSLEATEYQGPRNADGIVDYLKVHVHPACVKMHVLALHVCKILSRTCASSFYSLPTPIT